MKDAAHLTKLLRHADPAFFRSVLTTQYEVELPKIHSALGKQAIRKSFAEAMTFLSFSRRRELDEWAERINLLADTAGREAVESVRIGDVSGGDGIRSRAASLAGNLAGGRDSGLGSQRRCVHCG